MSGITINTDGLKGVASNIDKLNKHMTQAGDELTTIVKELSREWNSSAGSKVIGEFETIRMNFFNNRNVVMNDYVRFLYEQVGEGYDIAETTNVNLARAFK